MKQLTVILGVVIFFGGLFFLTSISSVPPESDEYITIEMYETPVFQRIDGDIYEYPSVYDAAIITEIPRDQIIKALRTGEPVKGNEFTRK